MHVKCTRVTRDISLLLYALWFARTAHVLHKLHSCILVCTKCKCILVCTSMRVFPTHFTCFIGVHSGLEYTSVIHSKANMCMRVYLHTTPPQSYRFRASNVNSANKFMLWKYTDDHVYSNTLFHLERFKNLERGFFAKQYGYCSRSEQR